MKDIYAEITNKIVAALESGVKPWRCGWDKSGNVSRPLRHNGQAYSGVNVLVLWLRSVEMGYQSPFWMTYNQAIELGGYVRKGEKGTTVCYANVIEKTEKTEAGEKTVKIPFMRSYTVFNADQIENLPERYRVKAVQVNQCERIEAAEKFFANTGAEVKNGGVRACYYPQLDTIAMPEFASFESAESYYGTLAHETIHWTKAKSRLDRNFEGGSRFGEAGYAMEELVAEMGAAFLCADLGIESPDDHENTAAYLGTWIKALKDDKKAIFTASSKATQAVQFLHGLQPAGAVTEELEAVEVV